MKRDCIVISSKLLDRLVSDAYHALPKKLYGVFIAHDLNDPPLEYHVFKSNIRNTREWKPYFEKYGEFYRTHPDAGFAVDPEELLQFYIALSNKDMIPIGLFHVHKWHRAHFSQLDLDLHIDPDLWHMIISLVDPNEPEIKVYCIEENEVFESPIKLI